MSLSWHVTVQPNVWVICYQKECLLFQSLGFYKDENDYMVSDYETLLNVYYEAVREEIFGTLNDEHSRE